MKFHSVADGRRPLLLAAVAGCDTPSDPASLIASAQAQRKKGDFPAAIINRRILQDNPDHPEARFLLGSAYLETGEPTFAMVELEKARALGFDPKQVFARTCEVADREGEVQGGAGRDGSCSRSERPGLAGNPERPGLRATRSEAACGRQGFPRPGNGPAARLCRRDTVAGSGCIAGRGCGSGDGARRQGYRHRPHECRRLVAQRWHAASGEALRTRRAWPF